MTPQHFSTARIIQKPVNSFCHQHFNNNIISFWISNQFEVCSKAGLYRFRHIHDWQLLYEIDNGFLLRDFIPFLILKEVSDISIHHRLKGLKAYFCLRARNLYNARIVNEFYFSLLWGAITSNIHVCHVSMTVGRHTKYPKQQHQPSFY